MKYIYDNPVKVGICNKAEEYEYSNYKEINFTVLQIQKKIKELCATNQ